MALLLVIVRPFELVRLGKLNVVNLLPSTYNWPVKLLRTGKEREEVL